MLFDMSVGKSVISNNEINKGVFWNAKKITEECKIST